MKFSQIYHHIIKLWPEEIEISDGFAIGKHGINFPALIKVWDEVDDSIAAEDHWLVLGGWCSFQAFASESRRLFDAGSSVLRTRDVPPNLIETRISENLKVDGWSDHRTEYENDLDDI